jgi:hypothetical protein
MEHIPDSTFVIPIVDQRSLLQLKRSLESIARQAGTWQRIRHRVDNLLGDLEHLRGLATLSRYALLGDRGARSTLQLELDSLVSEQTAREVVPRNATEPAHAKTCGAEPKVNLTALFDILLAGFMLYREDEDRYANLVKAVRARICEGLSVPLFYADSAREVEAAQGVTLPPEPARIALENLVRRLCESDRFIPPLPEDYAQRIDLLIEFWRAPNVVRALMETIDRNALTIASVDRTAVETAQRLRIELTTERRLQNEELLVLFAPAYYRARVLDIDGATVEVEVPPASKHSRLLVLSRPSTDALDEIERLNGEARAALPEIWGTSALGMISFNHWSYPSFTSNAVDIVVHAPVGSVELKIFEPNGHEVAGRRLAADKTYRLAVVPSDDESACAPFEHRVEFALGEVQTNEHNETLITPRRIGRGEILIVLPLGSRAFDVDVIPDIPGLGDLINDIVERDCSERHDDEACGLLGRWDPVIEDALAIVGVHAVLLHTGKVLFFSFDHRTVNNPDNLKRYFNNPNLGSYQVWDPATGYAEPVKPVGRNVFCAGQCQLPNGHILVAGGQDGAGAVELTEEWDKWLAAGGTFTFWIPGLDVNNGSSKDVHTYDPVADVWLRWPDMEENRYYPTCEVLPDGKAFVVAGLSNLQRFIASGANWHQVDFYETFDMDRLNEGALRRDRFRPADQYPIVRTLPGSNLLFAHIHNTTYLFDVSTGQWVEGAEFSPPEPVGRWTYPMQTGHVLLPQYQGDNPRIFISGGSEESNFDYNTHSNARAVQRGHIFELDADNVARSRWRETRGRPHVARLVNDHVLLPDGTVFIVNGISGGASSGHNQAPTLVCEIFDPVSETFTQVAPPDERHPRGYHATAILLPDGRVAIAGHTKTYNQPVIPDDTSIQVYYPPYLCRGPRPVIEGVARSYDYGDTIAAAKLDQTISKAIMIRPGGVTHSVDMSQRGIWLVVEEVKNQVRLRLPTDRSLAPPGYYMLFLLNQQNVPSLAHWFHVGREFYREPAMTTCPEDYTHEEPVHLGTIENHRTVEIARDGDIFIRKIDQHCNVQATSRCGSIYVEEKIDQHCWVKLSARHNVLIGEKADQHCILNIDCGGDVTFGWRRAGEGKIDQHCQVNVHSSRGSLTLTKKVDANSALYARIDEGDIAIREKVDGHSVCILDAPRGDIQIGEKVGGAAQVHWRAHSFYCPDTRDGVVDAL